MNRLSYLLSKMTSPPTDDVTNDTTPLADVASLVARASGVPMSTPAYAPYYHVANH